MILIEKSLKPQIVHVPKPLPVSGFLGVDLRRLPSVLSGSAFVQALKNTRSKLQAVVDLEREKIGISGVLTQNYRIFKTNFSNHKEKNRHVPKDSALSKPKVCR